VLGTSSLLLLVAASAKAGGSHQNIMLIMWEPLIMQELLISIMQELKSGRSWTSKVFNTVITLDTYQFHIKAMKIKQSMIKFKIHLSLLFLYGHFW